MRGHTMQAPVIAVECVRPPTLKCILQHYIGGIVAGLSVRCHQATAAAVVVAETNADVQVHREAAS